MKKLSQSSDGQWLDNFLSVQRPSKTAMPAFQANLSPSEQRAAESTRIARELIDAEMEERQALAARLKAARLEKEAEARAVTGAEPLNEGAGKARD